MTDPATAKGVGDALGEAFPLHPTPAGDAIAKIYSPDAAADASVARLISRLRELPWPKPEKETEQ